MSATLLLVRRPGAYDVIVNGEKAGCVCKLDDGWSFYSPVASWSLAKRLAAGRRTRRDAIIEGLGTLRIWHGGRICRLDMETMDEVAFYFAADDLRAIEDRLLDEKYPEQAASR